MAVIKKIAIGVGILVAVFIAVGLALPGNWHVQTSIVIKAPAAAIHPYIATPGRWRDWAAWNADVDPDVKWEYGGPDSGVGSWWSWAGPKMGRGKMAITRSDAAKGVWFDEHIDADEVNAHGSIVYAAVDGGTKLTWTDDGKLPPIVGGYFRSMLQGYLKTHFDKGLETLKRLVDKEVAAKADPGAKVAGDTPTDE